MMKEKKLKWLNYKTFIIILFLPAILCSHKEKNQNFFHTYIQSDPNRLDPFYSTDVVSGRILTKIFNGLFKINKEGRLKKDLLQSYSFDGRTLSATLLDNVFFHNGLKLKSDDVIFSFNRIKKSRNPTSPRRWIFNNIKSITKDNDNKFSIRLKKTSSTFLFLLTMVNCYIISKEAYERDGKITGCGPFKLAKWDRDSEIILVSNQKYFGRKPNIKGIIFKVIPEDLTARFEFLNGGIDYFELPYLTNINFEKDFQNKGRKIKILNVRELSVHYIALNTTRFPLNNKMFRRALNMAIDRERIIESLFNNRFTKASGPVPAKIGDYNTKVNAIPYDPQKARKIIEDMNIKDKSLSLFIKSDHQVSLTSQMIQYYLKQVGLNVKIHEMEWSALKASTIKGNYDLAYFTWHADYPEAENFLYPLFYSKNKGLGGNRSFFNNSVVDNLIIRARETTYNIERYKIYYKIERIIIDESPWIFLWYGCKKIAISDKVSEFTPYPLYNGMKGNEISIKSGN